MPLIFNQSIHQYPSYPISFSFSFQGSPERLLLVLRNVSSFHCHLSLLTPLLQVLVWCEHTACWMPVALLCFALPGCEQRAGTWSSCPGSALWVAFVARPWLTSPTPPPPPCTRTESLPIRSLTLACPHPCWLLTSRCPLAPCFPLIHHSSCIPASSDNTTTTYSSLPYSAHYSSFVANLPFLRLTTSSTSNSTTAHLPLPLSAPIFSHRVPVSRLHLLASVGSVLHPLSSQGPPSSF
ncbi:hypothetical protein HOY80DRAFT_141358 [Tuber brumale]|nr:hypothetical protein HOY80DRAFT_141358 [Tuber brumale]